jgi:hypothetical protein
MYLFATLFLSVFAYLEVFNQDMVKKYRMLFAFICYAFLIFHDGFRWETGCDWIPYTGYFDKLLVDFSITEPLFEVGYYLFMLPIRVVTDNYTAYLIIHALVFYTLMFYAVFKLSTSPFVSLLLLYMVIVPYMGTNRQFLALAIYTFGFLFLVKDKRWAFLSCVVLACFFHKSAVVCIFALFLSRKISNKYLIAVLGIAILISMSGIVNKVAPLLSVFVSSEDDLKKMDTYMNFDYDVSVVSTIFSLFRKLIWIALLMIFDKYVEHKSKLYYTFFNLYFLGSIFYVLFNGTMLQVFVSRALLYYNLMEIFIVPYVLTLFRPNYGKLVIMFTLTAYCWINISKGFLNYGEGTDYFEPYKGIFINTNYARQDQ